jgi:nitrite reductase/ring-hydroxylating ferredoxin subunit/uncharacterized membrane protein
MLARFVTGLIAAQGFWARPLGEFNARWLKALLGRMPSIKSFLNGTWLGHPVHGAVTDLPIGALTLALVLEVVALHEAADVALGIGILTMAGAAVAGLADYADTNGHNQLVATVHGTLMTVALVILLVALLMRIGPGADRGLPLALVVIGYLIVLAGAYVGGEIVYALGHMVNRHAWRFAPGPTDWQALDVTDIPEGTPVKAKAGAQTLLLVRQGTTIHALHEQCAHAGGPLSQGRIVDDCIECPWHRSRFELETGARRQGPTTFDQPRYEVRSAEGGGYEARRVTSGSGRPADVHADAA